MYIRFPREKEHREKKKERGPESDHRSILLHIKSIANKNI
jgi:hypothetical protein